MAEAISVAIRFRPLSDVERSDGTPWSVQGNNIQLADNRGNVAAEYSFDHVFDGSATSEDVFQSRACEIAKAVVDGFNGTIFAYGQTSSGKTFTMRGVPACEGVIPLSVRQVFDTISQTMNREFLLRVSYLEIYNEEINDLLAPDNRRLQIHESSERGVFVAGLHEEIVMCPDQVLELLSVGETNRSIGETKMNEKSSRSHAIFRMVRCTLIPPWPSGTKSRTADTLYDQTLSAKSSLTSGNLEVIIEFAHPACLCSLVCAARMQVLESREIPEDGATEAASPVLVSSLNLVDLAGSERVAKTGAEGSRLKEGAHINKSLMTLGTVINKLSEGADRNGAHIPYRDSKLTRILQPALGGNTKTAIICCATPALLPSDAGNVLLILAAGNARAFLQATLVSWLCTALPALSPIRLLIATLVCLIAHLASHHLPCLPYRPFGYPSLALWPHLVAHLLPVARFAALLLWLPDRPVALQIVTNSVLLKRQAKEIEDLRIAHVLFVAHLVAHVLPIALPAACLPLFHCRSSPTTCCSSSRRRRSRTFVLTIAFTLLVCPCCSGSTPLQIVTNNVLLKRQAKEIEDLRRKLEASHSPEMEQEIMKLRNAMLKVSRSVSQSVTMLECQALWFHPLEPEMEQEIMKLHNAMLKMESEKEVIALQLQEERAAHSQKEQRIKEQERKIENLSTLVIKAAAGDRQNDRRPKKVRVRFLGNRRESWCPNARVESSPAGNKDNPPGGIKRLAFMRRAMAFKEDDEEEEDEKDEKDDKDVKPEKVQEVNGAARKRRISSVQKLAALWETSGPKEVKEEEEDSDKFQDGQLFQSEGRFGSGVAQDESARDGSKKRRAAPSFGNKEKEESSPVAKKPLRGVTISSTLSAQWSEGHAKQLAEKDALIAQLQAQVAAMQATVGGGGGGTGISTEGGGGAAVMVAGSGAETRREVGEGGEKDPEALAAGSGQERRSKSMGTPAMLAHGLQAKVAALEMEKACMQRELDYVTQQAKAQAKEQAEEQASSMQKQQQLQEELEDCKRQLEEAQAAANADTPPCNNCSALKEALESANSQLYETEHLLQEATAEAAQARSGPTGAAGQLLAKQRELDAAVWEASQLKRRVEELEANVIAVEGVLLEVSGEKDGLEEEVGRLKALLTEGRAGNGRDDATGKECDVSGLEEMG
ncbi:unnamed protein product, partial [Closterium sp. NIES-54]